MNIDIATTEDSPLTNIIKSKNNNELIFSNVSLSSPISPVAPIGTGAAGSSSSALASTPPPLPQLAHSLSSQTNTTINNNNNKFSAISGSDKKLRKVSKDDFNFYALDHLYRTKQLKKQRRQDIQKLFNESANINQKYSASNNLINNINSSNNNNNQIGALPSSSSSLKRLPVVSSSNNNNNNNNNKASSSSSNNHKKQIDNNNKSKSIKSGIKKDTVCCKFTFIFDPNGRFSYWISFIVSLAFLYNFWVIIYRYSFNEINANNRVYWLFFDYLADFLYICDIIYNFRTGFLEDGVLQTDPLRLRHHYMNTTRFYIDCLCLIPLDILYLSIGFNSILRCFRLVKIYRFWSFLDRTERHTNYPNIFRSVVMLHYLFAIFHWNACFCVLVARYLVDDNLVKAGGASSSLYTSSSSVSSSILGNNFVLNVATKPTTTQTTTASSITAAAASSIFSELNQRFRLRNKDPNVNTNLNANSNNDITIDYLRAFYWSTMIMTLISNLPYRPNTKAEYMFICFELIFALLLFAAIMGHVAYIVANLGNARKEFQSKLDAVKTYMSIRRVPKTLQDRVIRWYDFLWMSHKSMDDNQILNLLPYKLRAEISIHVHLDTLKRVEIFQNTEAGFLNELVLRLKPVLYSPGDFICRKGEVGKEMYIVNRGKLHVISDNGKSVLATLKAGSYFGEISILNMGASGNRRTASVKSVGYSDLFCLSKEDLWEVLKEYPAVRVRLEAIAVKRLEKHKKSLYEQVNMQRCKSTPGLVEPSTQCEAIGINASSVALKRHSTIPPANLTKTTTYDYDAYDRKYSVKNNNTSKKCVTIEETKVCINNTNNGEDAQMEKEKEQLPLLSDINEKHISFNNSQNRKVNLIYNPSLSSDLNDDSTDIACAATTTVIDPKLLLIQEIQRLRKRLCTVETENTVLTLKLKQQHVELKNRIADIEMQINHQHQDDDDDDDSIDNHSDDLLTTTSDDYRV